MHKAHTLKTDSEVFQAVSDGRKTFEIRFNDRDFKVGDELILLETIHSGEQMKQGKPLLYSGNEIHKIVSYVLSGYGLKEGWVILGIQGPNHTTSCTYQFELAFHNLQDTPELRKIYWSALGQLQFDSNDRVIPPELEECPCCKAGEQCL